MGIYPVNLQPAHLTRESAVEKPVHLERRKRVRVQVRWPILFSQTHFDDVVQTVTHDLSSNGFYCTATATFIPGETLECTLILPTRSPIGRPVLRMLCRVRVIRVEAAGESGLWGMGFQIEDYRILHTPSALGTADENSSLDR